MGKRKLSSNLTIKDIASEAGVSTATISRALDPFHQNQLKPETLKKINKVCQKRNYTANTMARRFRRQKADAVSMILPLNVFDFKHSTNDFHPADLLWKIIDGVIREARKWHIDVKMEPLLDIGETGEIVERLSYPHSDGAVFMGGYELETLRQEVVKRQIPHVVLSTHILKRSDFPEISVDTRQGVFDATSYLLDRGYKKIGFISYTDPREFYNFTLRYSGYRDALMMHDLFDTNRLYILENEIEIRDWLIANKSKLPVDAVLAANDCMAYSLIRELQYQGFNVPEDVAVVGVDNVSQYAHGQNALSTVAIPHFELGREGTRILIKMIQDGEPFTGKKILPSTFIKRKTC